MGRRVARGSSGRPAHRNDVQAGGPLRTVQPSIKTAINGHACAPIVPVYRVESSQDAIQKKYGSLPVRARWGPQGWHPPDIAPDPLSGHLAPLTATSR
jgi:hypothetical protein